MLFKDVTEGQRLWYCKLDLHEVIYVKNPYNDGRSLARFPPNNIKCFTDPSTLYISRRNAINSLIKRIENMEGIAIKQDIRIEKFNSIMKLFDSEDRHLAFNQLISSFEERLTKLEQTQNRNTEHD
jgi:hypothetical protein